MIFRQVVVILAAFNDAKGYRLTRLRLAAWLLAPGRGLGPLLDARALLLQHIRQKDDAQHNDRNKKLTRKKDHLINKTQTGERENEDEQWTHFSRHDPHPFLPILDQVLS